MEPLVSKLPAATRNVCASAAAPRPVLPLAVRQSFQMSLDAAMFGRLFAHLFLVDDKQVDDQCCPNHQENQQESSRQKTEDHSAGHGGMALGSTSQATVLFQLRLKRPQFVINTETSATFVRQSGYSHRVITDHQVKALLSISHAKFLEP